MMNPSATGADSIKLKKFVTETEVADQKQKRQEEWEKKRTPDQPLECPEEEFDGRTLYDRLEDQKRQKTEETEEKFKLGNQVRGLDEDETKFLDLVSQRKIEINKERRNEEQDILQQIKQSTSSPVLHSGHSTTTKPTATVAPFGSSQSKSQSALLAGAIKRKSSVTDSRADEKKTKVAEEEPNRSNSEKDSSNSTRSTTQVARVIGILPGIGQYTVDSSASDSSSCDSDSESEPMIVPVTKPGFITVMVDRK